MSDLTINKYVIDNIMSYAILENNTINYSDLDKTRTRLNRDNLLDDIEDYINIYKCVDMMTTMEEIIIKCKFDPEDVINTTIIKETQNSVFYMVHTVDDTNQNYDINRIAMTLSKNVFRITGSVGIIKETYEYSNNETYYSTVALTDILDIYQKNLVFDGIKLNHDGCMDIIQYIYNPIDWLKPNESLNFKFTEFEIFGKIVMVFIELKPTIDSYNPLASILLGKKVHGYVIIALRDKIDDIKINEHKYESLDKQIIDKIIYVLKYCSQNEDSECHNIGTSNKVLKIDNFYTRLNDKYTRLLKMKNKIPKYESFDGLESFNDITRKTII